MKLYRRPSIRAFFLAFFLLASILTGWAQNRVLDHQAIGWFTYNGDHQLTKRWAIHTEYQWRRIDLIRSWQQSLARLGVIRKLNNKVAVGGGYTYFVTFPFGRYPQANQGFPYPEHRLHEDIQLKETYGPLQLTHRFRLEQRWLASQTDKIIPRRITGWGFQNRIRYQIAGQWPLQGKTIDENEWYLNFFDELFISFGKEVGANIFNQNRLSGGVGYQLQDGFKLELNYLNQVLQHGAPEPLSHKPIFEINNGFRLNVVYDWK